MDEMRKFILGTDWWSDCDDAVALRLLTRAMREGEVELIGVGINACAEHSVASLVGFLRADGIDIPVGIDLEATDFSGVTKYQRRLAEKYAPDSSGIYPTPLLTTIFPFALRTSALAPLLALSAKGAPSSSKFHQVTSLSE